MLYVAETEIHNLQEHSLK